MKSQRYFEEREKEKEIVDIRFERINGKLVAHLSKPLQRQECCQIFRDTMEIEESDFNCPFPDEITIFDGYDGQSFEF